jgi:hypothetical protein
MLNLVNFTLSGINLYGYYKCMGDYNQKIKAIKKEALSNLAGRILK